MKFERQLAIAIVQLCRGLQAWQWGLHSHQKLCTSAPAAPTGFHFFTHQHSLLATGPNCWMSCLWHPHHHCLRQRQLLTQQKKLESSANWGQRWDKTFRQINIDEYYIIKLYLSISIYKPISSFSSLIPFLTHGWYQIWKQFYPTK